MAQKRMFSMSIVDSDAFLDLPLSSQCLYFHLNMRADDDGFIGNPKRIQKLIGASEDDLKILIAKRFLLVFDDGVIVIKHWRMHNTIRSDRYTPTQYREELAMLKIKDNKSYSLTSGNQMATIGYQNASTGLGLDIGLDIDKDIEKDNRVDYQLIADMYNNTCVSFPRISKPDKLSESRKKAIKARLKTYSVDDFIRLFEMAERSSFLKGANDRNWSANFDWLIKDSNMAKVLDGNYEDKKTNKKVSNNKFNNFNHRNYDYNQLEKELLGIGGNDGQETDGK